MFLKKYLSLLLSFCILFSGITPVYAAAVTDSGIAVEQNGQKEEQQDSGLLIQKENQKTQDTTAAAFTLTAPAAVLIEGSTGKILFEKEKDTERMIASVTKIMTMLLIMEALDSGSISLEDTVTVSAHAASMGGSQVYLEENETQKVDTMLKCISISSANDAAVAMAEHLAGSEEAFVEKMNQRAAELGMEHTHFLNCCGLDDDIRTGHYSSAYDVAIMSRELITKHPKIKDYTTVWMDTFTHVTRKGEKEFGLSNTNRLVRTYEGITGLKTGSTSKAKYCLSATASRNGIDMIAVVLGAQTPKDRFAETASLLNYGFANTLLYKDEASGHTFSPVPVSRGKKNDFDVLMAENFNYVFTEGEDITVVTSQAIFQEKITAPVKKGDLVGCMEYSYQGEKIGSVPIVAAEDVEKAGFFDCIGKIFRWYAMLQKMS